MPSVLLDIVCSLGAFGIFIFGIKNLGEGIQKLVGKRLRQRFSDQPNQAFANFIFGFVTTFLSQSSATTTVMMVRFANIGIFNLRAALTFIIGANIGNALVVLCIGLLSFVWDISYLGTALIGISLPLFFLKKDLKYITELSINFALIFLGLFFLKSFLPTPFKHFESWLWLQTQFSPFISVGFFLFLGLCLTVLVRSSIVIIGLVFTLFVTNWISLGQAGAMILGANIGTTISANLMAQQLESVKAKRVAIFHSIFNVVGVLILLLLFQPILSGLSGKELFFDLNHIELHGFKSMQVNPSSLCLPLALFHLLLNMVTAVLFFVLLPVIEKMTETLLPNENILKEEPSVKLFINKNIAGTPDLSIAEVKKQIEEFSKLLTLMLNNVILLLFERPENAERLLDKIETREELSNEMEIAIAAYLATLSQNEISTEGSQRVQRMLNIINDMESIGNILYKISIVDEDIMQQNLRISVHLRGQIRKLFDTLKQQQLQTQGNLNRSYEKASFEGMLNREQEINELRRELQKLIFENVEKKRLSARESLLYMTIVNRAERLGDHLIYINEAIRN